MTTISLSAIAGRTSEESGLESASIGDERVQNCPECGKKLRESKAYIAVNGDYICRGPCLSTYEWADTPQIKSKPN